MKETPATSKPRLGPGEYKPDIAFERIEDLPRPKLIKQQRNHAHQPCPRCGRLAYRDRVFVRHLHDVGDLVTGRPHELQITYSQHYCSVCRKYFNVELTDLAPPYGHYTHLVMARAERVVAADGLAY